MHADIIDRPALRTATLRHTGPYSLIGETFDRLEPLDAAAGLDSSPTVLLAIYHDDPATTAEASRRSDAGIVLTGSTAVPAGLTEVTLAAGRYAWTRHIGPYIGLGATWAWLKGEWLPSSGHRKGPGPSYEVYPNNMGNAAPEALITDIYIPVS